MSTRTSSRKKVATSRLSAQDLDTPRSRRAKQPKYSNVDDGGDGLSSRGSSPGSRPVTPAQARRGRPVGSKSSTVSKLKKKGGRPSGTSTPVSRQSRASSVSSTAKAAAAASHKKGRGKGRPKTKTAASSSFKDTDYHYGSDFEGNIYEEENEDSDSSSDSDLSDMDSFSDDMKPESDVELEPNLIDDDDGSDWMDLDPANVPKLELPESSDDLLLLPDQAFEAITVYEVLRQYYKILRLSPFRFEDFCAMLASQDQSNLTSEVHICLLKALLREDDAQQAQYGPLDQKDSMNVFVNFVDPVTWPENLRFYLSTEPEVYKDALQVISSCEYPFTNVENRLKVLKILTDALLNTSAVRDDLLNEGSTLPEDHCRVCGKLGDMVICEHCNGPFHGTCLEPPMYEVPEDDWICPVCAENMIDGVYDCLSTKPGSCRIQQLGTDRHGSRYWFASRRIWVCSQDETEEPKYYSTKAQLTELLESIDKDKYERDLYENIIEAQEEMEKQMEVTEELTKKLNSKGLKSYLDTNNMVLDKLQQERNDLREFLEAEERKVQMDIDRQIREEEQERMRKQKEQERKEKEEKLAQLRKEREYRLKRRKGETNENGDAIVPPKDETAPETPEKVEKDGAEVEQEIEALEAEIKEDTLQLEQQDETDPKLETNAQQLKKVENYKGPRNMKDIKRGEMPPGPYYRLGEEYTYLVYVNQYSIHSHALSKSQNKEDSEKRIRMSHKFSLTDVCGFKWSGNPQGQRNTLVTTVRNTILSLENNIPTAFMHTNWPLLRKPWIQAVSTCTDANKDFSRALTVLSGCIKPCAMLPVWSDSLGHTSVKKVGYQGKEEKKRQEKREKKEREEEEERLKPYMTWVKYTLPVRSLAVVRQKGEEYRAHGRNGWLWLSATRSFRPRPSAQLGLKAGPFRIAANYTEIETGISKVVLMEPKALAFLLEVQRERDEAVNGTNGKEDKADGDGKVIEVEKQEEAKKRENLTKVLDVSRIDLMEPKEKDLGGPDGVVDVCHGMSQPNRLLYPRCAKKTKVDDLLVRRLHLKAMEEKRLNPLSSKAETETSLLSLEKWIQDSHEKLSAQVDAICSLQTSQLTCYSPMCRSNPLLAACYSPSCRKHIQTLKLADAADVYNKVMAESRQRAVKGLPGTTDIKFTYTTTALSALNNLISLVKAKEEEVNYESALQSLSTTAQATKENSTNSESATNNDIKTEPGDESKVDIKPDINKRIFSDPDTSKPIKLEPITMGESKQNRIVKYPLAPTFWSKMHSKRNILINSNHELHRLARQAGMVTIEGFNYNSKANASAWPYPCPRPTFKTAWLFRTASMNSLHSVALQLRILWACIRWDDMNTKPANPDGKHSETTDTEIVTTELLKHRNIGRYLEKTQYFQRRVTIPLDAPRKQVDYSPIRSGLRKRKRAESPVQAEPQVAEKWIDEHELELCDIRAYRDKLERGNDVPLTRANNGRNIKAPERYDPSDLHEVKKRNTNSSEMKAKFDAQIKEQREAFKASRSTTPDLPNTKPSLSGIRRESTIKMSPAHTTYTTSIPGVGGAKKVFLTKDGKIVGHQLIGGHAAAGMNNKVAIAPINKTTISTTKPTPLPPPVAQPTPASPGQQQKVQIVKTSDGKIQVRGLMPGQQLVQMPDGKLQIFSLPSTNAATTTTQQQPPAVGGSIGGVRLVSPSTQSSPAGTIRLVSSPSTQPQILQQQQPQPQLIQPAPTAVGVQRPTMLITSTASPLQTTTAVRPQIVSIVRPSGGCNIAGVTPIQPKPVTGIMPLAGTVTTPGGQPRLQLIQTPNGAPVQQTVRPIMSQPQPQLNKNTPGVIQTIGSVNNTSNAATPATPTVVSSPNKGGQLVGIQSLGQNTITVKDGQLIVQGPDHEAATNIARHLASGQAKLAHINGKQVLLITNPTQVQQQQQVVSGGQRMAVQPQQPQQSVLSSPQKLLSPTSQPQTPQPQILQQQPTPQQPGLAQQPQQPSLVPQLQQGLVRQSVTVSANLVQTEQGPRIILQGLQGVNLSQDHLANIQQQVKTQLLKQQALARQQQKPPPTKIFIELLLTNGGGQPMLKSPTVEPVQMLSATPGTAAPQLVTSQNQLITSQSAVPSPQQLISSNQMVSQQQVMAGQTLMNTLTTSPAKQQVSTLPGMGSSSQHSSVPTPMLNQDQQQPIAADKQPPVSLPQQPLPPQPQPVPLNTLPDHILKQGRYITKDGKRMLVLPQQVMQQYQQSLKQQQQSQQQQSAVGGGLGVGTGTSTTALPSTTTQSPSTESLNLLSPGSEAKLMSSTKLFSPSKLDDDKFELTDDYIQQTIKEALESGNLTPDLQEKLMSQLNQQDEIKVKSKTNSNRKGKKKSDLFDPVTGERLDDEWEPGSWSAKAKINNQIRKEKVAPAAVPDDFSSTQVTPKVPASSVSKQQPTQNQPQHPQQVQQKKKFTMYTTPRLNTMLFKHKEQLKKDIAKKRALLEKDLMQDIQREIDSLKQQAALKLGTELMTSNNKPPPQQQDHQSGSDSEITNSRKRKMDASPNLPNQPPGKKRPKAEKNERLYCICKTKLDPSKFYVGCDLCQNWFHGSCVGITQKMSKKMTEYICNECEHAKLGTETYCMCKQPYDEARFYIGCERCPDWLHGRCVGILQVEAEGIQDYECPKCNPKSALNLANLKQLKSQDLDVIKKLFKQIQSSKHSVPFKKPMEKKTNKKYYELVKEPMDLETMDKKLERGEYKTLAEFLGDLTRITENCRYYYPPESGNSKHAEQLELFILEKLGAIRQKLLESK